MSAPISSFLTKWKEENEASEATVVSHLLLCVFSVHFFFFFCSNGVADRASECCVVMLKCPCYVVVANAFPIDGPGMKVAEELHEPGF